MVTFQHKFITMLCCCSTSSQSAVFHPSTIYASQPNTVVLVDFMLSLFFSSSIRHAGHHIADDGDIVGIFVIPIETAAAHDIPSSATAGALHAASTHGDVRSHAVAVGTFCTSCVIAHLAWLFLLLFYGFRTQIIPKPARQIAVSGTAQEVDGEDPQRKEPRLACIRVVVLLQQRDQCHLYQRPAQPRRGARHESAARVVQSPESHGRDSRHHVEDCGAVVFSRIEEDSAEPILEREDGDADHDLGSGWMQRSVRLVLQDVIQHDVEPTDQEAGQSEQFGDPPGRGQRRKLGRCAPQLEDDRVVVLQHVEGAVIGIEEGSQDRAGQRHQQ
mmetsp:Transcript_17904/g.49653  ORF Transcript_17904/g.49653 Transcript_17904/m.49653 type:complete len:330 (+) Transcript_17904:26-1015(+)